MSLLTPTVLRADFIAEARDFRQAPVGGPPEIAIAGRSNVGKSTLLNRLAARRSLARTSKTPGRTRGLIFYELKVQAPAIVDPLTLRLVDLPGYGYARVSQQERRDWQTLVEGYVERRSSLRLFFVLVDARRDIQEEELQLLEWLASVRVPHQVVATKTDKLSAAERGALRDRLRKTPGAEPPLVTLTSGETGEGVDRLWAAIVRAVH